MNASDALRARDRVRIRLVWQSLAEMDENYTVFVHLLGPESTFWGQHDGEPQDGRYPTSYWRRGERVADEHELVVSEDAQGTGQMAVGMYLLETMDRLEPTITLRQVEVRP
jgi:hypothetical protein